MLTYWRHFLRSSPHSASSSAVRSITRVATGWTAGAGCQPAPRRAAPTAPPASGPASRSTSGSIRRWLARAARSSARASSVNRPTASPLQSPSTGPRGAYANAHGSRPGRRVSTWAPIGDAARMPRPVPAGAAPPASYSRCAAQPLTALTRAQPPSWRYEPRGSPSTNASQAAASAVTVGTEPVASRSRAVTPRHAVG